MSKEFFPPKESTREIVIRSMASVVMLGLGIGASICVMHNYWACAGGLMLVATLIWRLGLRWIRKQYADDYLRRKGELHEEDDHKQTRKNQ
jgi:hypothetical protein